MTGVQVKFFFKDLFTGQFIKWLIQFSGTIFTNKHLSSLRFRALNFNGRPSVTNFARATIKV